MTKEKKKEEGLIKEQEGGSPICGKWEWNGSDGRGCEFDSEQGRPLVHYLGTHWQLAHGKEARTHMHGQEEEQTIQPGK